MRGKVLLLGAVQTCAIKVRSVKSIVLKIVERKVVTVVRSDAVVCRGVEWTEADHGMA